MKKKTFNRNKKYKISSGLGGNFTIKFKGTSNEKYLFKVINKGWEQVLRIREKDLDQIQEA